MMKFFVFFLLIPPVYSIPDHRGSGSGVFESKNLSRGLEEEVLLSLRLPHALARENLSKRGAEVYGPLKSLAFNEKIPMKTRWKSFMVYTQMAGSESFPQINQALEHRAWFMRSAALAALEKIDESSARRRAFERLTNDPALMVRAKALEILKKRFDDKTTELFWRKLHSTDSFHNHRGLWIRQRLVISLMENPRKGDSHRWARLLHEPDSRLQQIAARVLSEINKDPAVSKDVSFWKKRYPKIR